jgi:hypothetical protein
MANWKVIKGTVGPWANGEVFTDADLKDNAGLGGVKRLRDQLGVIEETDEEPGKPGDRAPELATGNPLGPRESVAERLDKSKLGDVGGEGDDGPNAQGRRRAGKS